MIKHRIIQLIESQNIPKEDFYKKIGMTSASFRGDAKKTPINSTAIENIISEIPSLNLEWLFTGEGEMLKDGGTTIKENNNSDFDTPKLLMQILETQKEILSRLDETVPTLDIERQVSEVRDRIKSKELEIRNPPNTGKASQKK